MSESKSLESYRARVDGAFRDASLHVRQRRAVAVLFEARKRFPRKDFGDLQARVT